MPDNLQVVLVPQEIPNNTGSIGRLYLATYSVSHWVGSLGSKITDT
jgi:tRNA(Leu) C34 or U34 (ribose-2'-O)-methylase TrmL